MTKSPARAKQDESSHNWECKRRRARDLAIEGRCGNEIAMASGQNNPSDDSRKSFVKFRDATRRILTTPKADLIGQSAPKKHPVKGKKK